MSASMVFLMSDNVIKFMPTRAVGVPGCPFPIMGPQFPADPIIFQPDIISVNPDIITIMPEPIVVIQPEPPIFIQPALPVDMVKPQALTNGQIIALVVGCAAAIAIAATVAMVIMHNDTQKHIINLREDMITAQREMNDKLNGIEARI